MSALGYRVNLLIKCPSLVRIIPVLLELTDLLVVKAFFLRNFFYDIILCGMHSVVSLQLSSKPSFVSLVTKYVYYLTNDTFCVRVRCRWFISALQYLLLPDCQREFEVALLFKFRMPCQRDNDPIIHRTELLLWNSFRAKQRRGLNYRQQMQQKKEYIKL